MGRGLKGECPASERGRLGSGSSIWRDAAGRRPTTGVTATQCRPPRTRARRARAASVATLADSQRRAGTEYDTHRFGSYPFAARAAAPCRPQPPASLGAKTNPRNQALRAQARPFLWAQAVPATGTGQLGGGTRPRGCPARGWPWSALAGACLTKPQPAPLGGARCSRQPCQPLRFRGPSSPAPARFAALMLHRQPRPFRSRRQRALRDAAILPRAGRYFKLPGLLPYSICVYK